jgi:hypothetical protein
MPESGNAIESKMLNHETHETHEKKARITGVQGSVWSTTLGKSEGQTVERQEVRQLLWLYFRVFRGSIESVGSSVVEFLAFFCGKKICNFPSPAVFITHNGKSISRIA